MRLVRQPVQLANRLIRRPLEIPHDRDEQRVRNDGEHQSAVRPGNENDGSRSPKESLAMEEAF